VSPTLAAPVLPPFCTPGPDYLPDGPVPDSDESVALAAWEVLTGARVARSAGSGRLSLLGRYERTGKPPTRERALWIALHAFEGADERWECRRARARVMSDEQLAAAIVQEMGGPAGGPGEMTTLGFWLGDTGFHFDCRGPCIEFSELSRGEPGAHPEIRRRRMGRTALLRAARRVLCIGPSALSASEPTRPSPARSARVRVVEGSDTQAQLSLL
jgi:hypothetical protein